MAGNKNCSVQASMPAPSWLARSSSGWALNTPPGHTDWKDTATAPAPSVAAKPKQNIKGKENAAVATSNVAENVTGAMQASTPGPTVAPNSQQARTWRHHGARPYRGATMVPGPTEARPF
eukprot:361024-Chlamydomonas_euryale.AAC.2